MATPRLGITLLSESQAGKALAVNAALNLVDSGAAVLAQANTFTQANVFSGSLRHTGTQAAFFNAALANQPANSVDLVTVLNTLGLRASGGSPGLNLNGGILNVGQALFSGVIGGNGTTAFSIKRFALTFPSDADYTLASGEADAIVIDVQTGVTTATRNIIVPTTGSAFYIVLNRNAQSVVLKTSGGTGITVAATRAAGIIFPTGANAFRLFGDTNYAV